MHKCYEKYWEPFPIPLTLSSGDACSAIIKHVNSLHTIYHYSTKFKVFKISKQNEDTQL